MWWPSNHPRKRPAPLQNRARQRAVLLCRNMSKDLKPKVRIGQKRSLKSKIAGWTAITLVCGGAAVAAYRLTGTTEVDVPVAKVRRADFVISVRTRGEIRSTRSVILTAPQVPDTRIVKLVES